MQSTAQNPSGPPPRHGNSRSFAEELLAYGLLLLTLTAATGAFLKFGIASHVWALIYMGTAVFVLRDLDRCLSSITATWPVLVLPLCAILSVLWSVDPASSFRHAAQYTFTLVMGIWIGSTFRLTALYAAMCVSLLGCVLLSIVLTHFGLIQGYSQGHYVGAEIHFVGLFVQKNVLGIVMVYAVLSTLILGAILRKSILAHCCVFALIPAFIMTFLVQMFKDPFGHR